MNLIFLFRRLVFAQVLLGIVAFCMAERNPGLLLVAGALGALSWYVVEGPTGRPLPHWIIILGAVASVVWLLLDLRRQQGEVIVVMGHFTMWLQVLLLYGRKTNREYGEILVLSLLQMIGASVLPAGVTMIYGALLTAYCVLALFTVLLFQLKNTSDLVLESNQAAAPRGVVVNRPKAVFGRGHRWQFRLVTVAVGVSCAVVAVAVFLLVPRTGGSRISPYLLSPIEEKQTGFSPVVQLNGAPSSAGNRDPVLNFAVWMNDQLQDTESGWLLRGAALDRYDPANRSWTRSPGSTAGDVELEMPAEGLRLVAVPQDAPSLDAVITMRTTAQRTLFTLFPTSWVQMTDSPRVLFNPRDQQITTAEAFIGAVRYRLRSPLLSERGPMDFPSLIKSNPPPILAGGRLDDSGYARGWPGGQVAPIRALALAAIHETGLERDPTAAASPDDFRIAHALEEYLRDHYTYSLTARPPESGDPVGDFLFRSRQGHCEVFASALAAMARSIGMPARVVTGYRASEFNRIGGYYIVRQSNAHAWTEIHCGAAGWQTLDATPPDLLAQEHRVERGWGSSLRDLYDHLEFTWITMVVAYDRGARDKVLSSVSHSIEETALTQKAWILKVVNWVKDFFSQWEFDRLNLTLTCFVLFFILVGIASLIHTTIVRHRRLVALQLTSMPRSRRRGLVKQLKFYLVMLDMLERHGFVRPSWQSPFSFAQELAEAHPLQFDPVISLTELFYEIRFGGRQLDKARFKLIDAHLEQLSYSLAKGRGRKK